MTKLRLEAGLLKPGLGLSLNCPGAQGCPHTVEMETGTLEPTPGSAAGPGCRWNSVPGANPPFPQPRLQLPSQGSPACTVSCALAGGDTETETGKRRGQRDPGRQRETDTQRWNSRGGMHLLPFLPPGDLLTGPTTLSVTTDPLQGKNGPRSTQSWHSWDPGSGAACSVTLHIRRGSGGGCPSELPPPHL